MNLLDALAASDASMMTIFDLLIRRLDGVGGFSRADFIAELRIRADQHEEGGSTPQMVEQLRARIAVLASDHASALH